ncbi:hypothetical protein F5887DRAFT_938029 [Amanita rubescens]|nr:hypothetical protein F5887DRAFT_938029 [Amanita rubescens]
MLSTAARSLVRKRAFNTSALRRSEHGDYKHFPFDLPTQKNKGIFGLKLFLFMASGFSIPFIASAYQLRKAAA